MTMGRGFGQAAASGCGDRSSPVRLSTRVHMVSEHVRVKSHSRDVYSLTPAEKRKRRTHNPHSAVCAASALMRSLHRSRKLRADDFLGRPTYLEPKGEGESSMLATRGSAKVCSVVVPASPVRMVKLGAPSRAVHVLNPSPTRCQCRPSQHT